MKKLFAGVHSLYHKIHANQLFRIQPFSTIKSESLQSRIANLGGQGRSVVPVLDRWIEEGKTASKLELHGIIKDLRTRRRFKHALEVMDWMTNKRHLPVGPLDASLRLNLIFKAYGLEQAENYFNNIPENFKGVRVYLALLQCYTAAKSVDKAEAIMQKARDSGYASKPIWYTLMMDLYYQLGNNKRFDDMLTEMEEKGISYNQFTLSLCLRACARNSDIAGIDRFVGIMKSNPQGFVNWHICVVAAGSYLKVGVIDKALEMLRKLEGQLTGTKQDDIVFVFLLKLYAEAGKKGELYRVWNVSKKNPRIANKVYSQMMCSLMIFDDIEGVEKIFEEWESVVIRFDFRIPNMLIGFYCKGGNFEKAEALLAKGKSKGCDPTVATWCYFAEGYLKKNEVRKAVEALNNAILVCPASFISQKDTMTTCLEYLENGEECLEKVEELIKWVRVSRFPRIPAPLDVR